jgi:release factor glutamine methyltransferase
VSDIETLLRDASQRLRAAGVEDARRDARLLLQAATATSLTDQIAHPERTIGPALAERFARLVSQRAARKPMAQILGKREFWSLEFAVTADTLDPRPDSETLVQAVLERISDRTRPQRLVDFGTGTGCLLLALLHELPAATGIGIDASPSALAVARGNAEHLGLAERARFEHGDWDAGLAPGFDVVVSNPPYVPRGEIDGLQPEVAQFEPRLALDGGVDGLDAYRCLLPAAHRLLSAGGWAAFEIGLGQSDSVIALGRAAGLDHLATAADLGGVERCVLFGKS